MPCVCLRNTFASWQRLKAEKLAIVNAQRALKAAQAKIKPAKDLGEAAICSNEKILRVPHPRRSFGEQKQNALESPLTIINGNPTRADLINAESRLGGAIFGPIPQGHRREFFHDRHNIWIWYEGWKDEKGDLRQFTVRYDVRVSGIYKKVASGKYLRLEGAELDNFVKATKAYLYMIKRYLYKKSQPVQNVAHQRLA